MSKSSNPPPNSNPVPPSTNTMPPPPNYTEAFNELQTIIAEIEGGSISVDQLAEKVKRAALLIRICQDKLHATEDDVNKILAGLESIDEPVSFSRDQSSSLRDQSSPLMDKRSDRDRATDADDAAGD
jgi:exodeoxyribonuclease VII small subunit